MLEVLPIQETIETLRRYYPAAKRLTVLSENSVSEQKNKEYLLPIFASLGLTTDYVLVDMLDSEQDMPTQSRRHGTRPLPDLFVKTHQGAGRVSR